MPIAAALLVEGLRDVLSAAALLVEGLRGMQSAVRCRLRVS